MSLRLLVETPPSLDQFEYIIEEKNSKGPSVLKIKGVYMESEAVNKNRRCYTYDDMRREVNRYTEELINTQRALGELNHPASAEVDLERACHLVTDLHWEGKSVIGTSTVLSTPTGQIVRSLINDGVKVGMSSRALGQLTEESNGINRVHDMRLIAVDCVADPSCPKAFVNGILESKQYVLRNDGRLEEIYERFEKSLKNLPSRDVQAYLKEQVMSFLSFLTK
jgi:hypothetical protein